MGKRIMNEIPLDVIPNEKATQEPEKEFEDYDE